MVGHCWPKAKSPNVFIMIIIIPVPNIEEEVEKVAGDDGEVRFTDFMKFATPTELCKIDHARGSFLAAKEEEGAKKKDSRKGNKVRAGEGMNK